MALRPLLHEARLQSEATSAPGHRVLQQGCLPQRMGKGQEAPRFKVCEGLSLLEFLRARLQQRFSGLRPKGLKCKVSREQV